MTDKNKYLQSLLLLCSFTILIANIGFAADKKTSESSVFGFNKYGMYKNTGVLSNAGKRVLQGYNMRVWLTNEMVMGCQAWDVTNCSAVPGGFGLEYPVGSGIEHVYGAGPRIGGIIDGSRYVSEAYNGNDARKEFAAIPKDSLRDRIWQASASDTFYDANRFGYYKKPPSNRDADDDQDGLFNEDELDGLDNDNDWVQATDDLGADGLPDSLESGCKGGYDPVTNPDPAFDNYEPTKRDVCKPDGQGIYPLKKTKDVYTQGNGIPDHGEPHVDEDYAAYSDNDLYFGATDTLTAGAPVDHKPMKVKIWARSYAFSGTFAEGILFFEYAFVNVGRKSIFDAFVGFFADMDVGPNTISQYASHDYAAYFSDRRTAYIHNAQDRGSTPMGITVLGTPKPLDQLTYTFQWHEFTPPCGGTDDSLLYSCMSCESFAPYCVKTDQPSTTPNDTRFLFSFGPFDEFKPGDTIKISVALVGGDGVESGPNNLKDNAEDALKIFIHDFRPPIVPPSPCLNVDPGFKKITLNWGKLGKVQCLDPLQLWDDSNKIAGAYPDTHWRRINPPPGHSTGGRIFEGYRLYRSEDPSGAASSFTLLKQFDVADDDYEYNVGVDSLFIDTNLVRGKTYWYAVTSFGLPDLSIITSVDSLGNVHRDSLYTGNAESSIEDNKTKIVLPFDASDKLGEVLAVPNPYRVDQDYTFESGGWEGRARNWTESERLLKFIHLPPKCTIRIFTLSGDLVTTLEHDDPVRGEIEWNILSESNRALASGVYVFTVESDFGRQIGKFVLIR